MKKSRTSSYGYKLIFWLNFVGTSLIRYMGLLSTVQNLCAKWCHNFLFKCCRIRKHICFWICHFKVVQTFSECTMTSQSWGQKDLKSCIFCGLELSYQVGYLRRYSVIKLINNLNKLTILKKFCLLVNYSWEFCILGQITI